MAAMSDADRFPAGTECAKCVEGGLAVAFCQQCAANLCDECVSHHKRMIETTEHDIIHSPQADEIRKQYQCVDHGKHYGSYCADCNKPICEDCFRTSSCRSHTISARSDVQKEIEDQLAKVQGNHKRFLSHVERIDSVAGANEKALSDCENKINKAFNTVVEKLNENREQILKQLRLETAINDDDVQQQKKLVQEKLTKMGKAIQETEKLLKSKEAKLVGCRTSTLEQLEEQKKYTWETSRIKPKEWQIKHPKPIAEYAQNFGKLIPKPRPEDIIVEGLDEPPLVGKKNEFTIVLHSSDKMKRYDATPDIAVQITLAEPDFPSCPIKHSSPQKLASNRWSLSYFLRKPGTVSIAILVCGTQANGSPFTLETVQIPKISVGTKVIRGPDWKWGDQDGGEGNVGEVVEVRQTGWVIVKWNNSSQKHDYRWGAKDAFDLKTKNTQE